MDGQAVIVSAVRTPIGRFQGSLKTLPAPQLGALAIRAALDRAALDPGRVDEVVMGCVLQAGLGQNPARQAALRAGLPATVAAQTINMVCGSGLRSVMLAAQSLLTRDTDYVIAGGMESMSNAPYLLPGARDGYRLGHGQLVDSMISDGLWCAFENWHMGETGEVVAATWGISRERQDRYAAESQARAVAARLAGHFTAEIVPVAIRSRPGAGAQDSEELFTADEGPRAGTTPERLAALPPAFRQNGTVTAGNAATINDGAAALLLTRRELALAEGLRPLARLVAQAVSGIEPRLVMMAPVEAIRKVAARAGWGLDEVDLFELNEAFAVQAIAVIEQLQIDPRRVNVNGGAIALGHPIGASGARILVTLLHEMERRDVARGIAALCLGGGNAVAVAVERERP
jgi:acetyl-CoA C-acetyltransferase